MILPIQPVAKPRMTQSDRWRERPEVMRYRHYKEKLINLSLEMDFQIGDTLDGLTFVLPMAKSWSKKKKQNFCGKPHQQRPDLDNLVKAFQDALCREDSHIHTYNKIRKVWGYHGAIIIKNLT